jgi:hypothetical protein
VSRGHWVHDQLRTGILRRLGVEAATGPRGPVDLDEVYERNWSPRFVELMRNRMALGFFRYGGLITESLRRYDNVASAIRRLRLYLVDGNQEHLVDAANLCLCEFVTKSSNPRAEWRPVDDGEHTAEVK